MFIELLLSSPVLALVWVLAIIIALTVHEFAHAYVAARLGDHTAESMGRLTLNPLAHVDLFGLLPLLILGFGWAKPVPFNPYNLKDPRRDSLLIALAGPGANILLALFSALIFQGVIATGLVGPTTLLSAFLILLIILNLFLVFFNILPIAPLDGSKIIDALLVKPEHAKIRFAIAHYGPQVLLALIIISILTPFDVFFFVSTPAFFVCDTLLGTSCSTFLGMLLSM
ncbi:MAG: site-2 protease family protein [Patescibacteria group bacterium]|jgi:Zn-dependent protease